MQNKEHLVKIVKDIDQVVRQIQRTEDTEMRIHLTDFVIDLCQDILEVLDVRD